MGKLIHGDFDDLDVRVIDPGYARIVKVDMSCGEGRHLFHLPVRHSTTGVLGFRHVWVDYTRKLGIEKRHLKSEQGKGHGHDHHEQWRICFEWPAGALGPSNVEIADYH